MALGPGTSELTPTMVDPPRAPLRVATVRRQFDQRAARLPAHDALLREVERRLLERLDLIRLVPRRVLDIGCGRGQSRALLAARYPLAEWVGLDLSAAMLRGAAVPDGTVARWWRRLRGEVALRVQADAACLPLADGSADLVCSNLMLHWHPTPHALFPEWKRVLRVEGLLLFSCFGPDTLRELRAACAQALPRAAPMPFIDMHDFGDMMVAAGFATPVMDVEVLRLTYPSPQALLREVAALGGNARDDRAPALVSGARARAARGPAGAARRRWKNRPDV